MIQLTRDDLELPEQSLLEQLLEEERHDRSDRAFAKDYLTGVIDQCSRDPLRYRGFGPWWWALKAVMPKLLLTPPFGGASHDEWAELLMQPNIALTCVAAALYEEQSVVDGSLKSEEHQIALSSGEAHTFYCGDPAMEALHVIKRGFSRGR